MFSVSTRGAKVLPEGGVSSVLSGSRLYLCESEGAKMLRGAGYKQENNAIPFRLCFVS